MHELYKSCVCICNMNITCTRDSKDKSIKFCRTCEKYLPKDQFDPTSNRRFCYKHLREICRWYRQGSQARRGVTNLRIQCCKDKKVFGQPKSAISCQNIRDMLTEDQLNHFSDYSIVPKDPTQPISISNSVLITAKCRKYLVSCWKVTKDLEQYQQILQMQQFKI